VWQCPEICGKPRNPVLAVVTRQLDWPNFVRTLPLRVFDFFRN
jgi:hypothetical protein